MKFWTATSRAVRHMVRPLTKKRLLSKPLLLKQKKEIQHWWSSFTSSPATKRRLLLLQDFTSSTTTYLHHQIRTLFSTWNHRPLNLPVSSRGYSLFEKNNHHDCVIPKQNNNVWKMYNNFQSHLTGPLPKPMQHQLHSIRTFASKKHKMILRHSKGFRGRAKNCYTIAIRRVHKAWQYMYRDRKVRKRNFRSLWIQRLNAGFRQYQWSYSRAIPALKASDIWLNRKVLSDLAAQEPFSFKAVIDTIQKQQRGGEATKKKNVEMTN